MEIVTIEEPSSAHTPPASITTSFSLPMFSGMLKIVVCFRPAPLLVLSLAISAINILIYPSVLFQWLAFLLLLSSIYISTDLIVTLFIHFIERYFVLKIMKAFYFVFALRTSVEWFFASSTLLLSWFLLTMPQMSIFFPHMSIFVIHFLTSTLVTSVIATFMWMFNILIFTVLDCRFRDPNFFETIQVLISKEYVLQVLLGSIAETREFQSNNNILTAFYNFLLIMSTRLHTICDQVGKSNLDPDHQVEHVISLVLKNLTNNELRDIQETDLLSVMEEEAITDFLQFFDGTSETKIISQESLRKYVVKLCNDRKHLVKLLNTSSKVIVQLSKNALVIQAFLVALVWILLMGIETTKSHVYTLLLLVLGFYCKIISDGAMLAIVTHPFDLGDHCIIDDEPLVVEDMGLINTCFLKENGTKLKVQNSVLQTKSISNLNRSTELTETFQILVSGTTSSDKIEALRLKIDELVKSKPVNWRAYCFNDMGIEDDKHIYNLEITDVRKFQNYKVKKERRSELILRLRQFLRDLGIINFTIK